MKKNCIHLPFNHIVSEGTLFNISKIHKKIKQYPIYIKNYTAHPHDMVQVHGKFWENTAMRLRVRVQKRNVTDIQTDRRGTLQ